MKRWQYSSFMTQYIVCRSWQNYCTDPGLAWAIIINMHISFHSPPRIRDPSKALFASRSITVVLGDTHLLQILSSFSICPNQLVGWRRPLQKSQWCRFVRSMGRDTRNKKCIDDDQERRSSKPTVQGLRVESFLYYWLKPSLRWLVTLLLQFSLLYPLARTIS